MSPLLTVYFTSDIHGYLYPTNFQNKEPQPMGLLSMRFPKDENTLVIDGGDMLQGSPLTYFGRSEGVDIPIARAMNARDLPDWFELRPEQFYCTQLCPARGACSFGCWQNHHKGADHNEKQPVPA